MKERTSMDGFLKEFHIGTYYLQKNARTEQHIKDLRHCGIDLVFGMDNDENALELFRKYGIYGVLGGIVPGWFGGHGENAGTLRATNKPEAYIAGAKAFADHPAVVGIDLGDEPSSLDFPYYGEIVKLTRELFPGKLLYLNLYPSYGMLASNSPAQSVRELGTVNYRDYLNAYCKHVDLPYLSFDHYVYSSDREIFLRDLCDAAACCKEYGKTLFLVAQVNSYRKDVYLSAEQLRFQAFSALAFGAGCVSWACYSAGWWHNQVLDEAGGKTEQYEKLKTVNAELRPFGEALRRCRWENTLRLEADTPCNLNGFTQITASAPAVLGIFTDEKGNPALFLSPLGYESGDPCSLRLRYDGHKSLCCRTTSGTPQLVPGKDGRYELSFDRPEPCFLFFGP